MQRKFSQSQHRSISNFSVIAIDGLNYLQKVEISIKLALRQTFVRKYVCQQSVSSWLEWNLTERKLWGTLYSIEFILKLTSLVRIVTVNYIVFSVSILKSSFENFVKSVWSKYVKCHLLIIYTHDILAYE